MSKKRILTAVILMPLVIWGVLVVDDIKFALISGLILLAAAWEWSNLMGNMACWKRIGYVVLNLVLMLFLVKYWIALYAPSFFGNVLQTSLTIVCLWWVVAAILIANYPKYTRSWSSTWVRGAMGILSIISAWISLNIVNHVNNFGHVMVLFLLFIVWAADIGAYFGGKLYGSRKFAPAVSPNKTWEGTLSGFVLALALMAGLGLVLRAPLHGTLSVLSVTFVVVLYAVMGDLFVSMLKRNSGVKDTGALLPGHGGILDRIDSLIAAAPVYALLLLLLS